MTYDPRSALRAVLPHFRKEDVPLVGQAPAILNASGGEYQVKERPETLCFFLLEWLSGDVKLPEDFAAVGTSAKALKAHARPDGGLYVGTFSGTAQPSGDDVVVFGDPLMTRDQAIATAHAFRRFHAEQHAGMPIRRNVEVVS